MKRIISAGALLILASAAAMAVSGPAAASVPPPWGCRYVGTNPVIHTVFDSGVTSPYRTAVINGANAWNRTSAAGSFQIATSGANLRIYTISSLEDYWAQTGDCLTPGYFAKTVETQFNDNTMASLSAHQKMLVAEHELGHAYGLGENGASTACADPMHPSVMVQGAGKFSCPGTAPWADDVTGVNNIY